MLADMNRKMSRNGSEVNPYMRAMRIHRVGPMEGRAAPLTADRVATLGRQL